MDWSGQDLDWSKQNLDGSGQDWDGSGQDWEMIDEGRKAEIVIQRTGIESSGWK